MKDHIFERRRKIWMVDHRSYKHNLSSCEIIQGEPLPLSLRIHSFSSECIPNINTCCYVLYNVDTLFGLKIISSALCTTDIPWNVVEEERTVAKETTDVIKTINHILNKQRPQLYYPCAAVKSIARINQSHTQTLNKYELKVNQTRRWRAVNINRLKL